MSGNFVYYYLLLKVSLLERKKVKNTYNFLMPDSEDFFQGASSGSYGKGPWTGASSSTGLKHNDN